MVKVLLKKLRWKVGAIAPASCITLLIGAAPVTAQSLIVPDDTLGGEQSQVIQNFGGLPIEVIFGGAQRSQNLFHSFEEFNVDEGRGAIFFSPDDVNTIFSRVTGSNLSNILGLLGTIGSDADLFFMNPNGILFGPNSSLNVQGSFAAITADAIQFGDQGFFSASNPEIPSDLLTINPSALFFNQVPVGSISITSIAPAGFDPTGSFETFGLRVPDGRSLLLVGGDINLDRGGLIAFGGRIDLGAVGGAGTLRLDLDGNRLAASFPDDIQRGDITLADNAALIVAAGGGGDVAITSRNLRFSDGSTIRAGLLSGLGSTDAQGGDILIDTTERTELSSSLLFNSIEANAQGNTGQTAITTGSLSIVDGAQILAIVRGEGNAGPIIITADESVSLDGRDDNDFPSSIASSVEVNGVGTAGDIEITANVLEIANRAQLNSSTSGLGDAGDITLSVDDQVVLDSSIILSEVSERGGVGRGGDIVITTRSLRILNGSSLLSDSENQGDAGNISIIASDAVTLLGEGPSASDPSIIVPSQISTTVDGNAVGEGGDIDIETGSFFMTDDSFVRASTFGQGNAGNIDIEADSIELTFGADIQASTSGQGNAGQIDIDANDTILLAGRSTDESPSLISTNIQETATGNSGGIVIAAREVQLRDRSQISSAVAGTGNSQGVSI
ncbi:MAG: filamentous hemagglutinin N-terminal domain-containing protein, partial [Leptolyngbyaceae bacterium]|nr:filamentous hemagglutinin N-terminal domain-containing protein [Leptolyngbyaceae bacterium]